MQRWYYRLFSILNEKYDSDTVEKILRLQGLAEEKLNPLEYFERLLNKGLQSETIDPNANMPTRVAPVRLQSELFKPQKKLLGLKMLFDKLVELYGEEVAKECMCAILDGTLYLHDSTGIWLPYCGAIQSLPILLKGRPWARHKPYPPNHPHSFLGQLLETIFNISQEQQGACSIADFFIVYAYTWAREWYRAWGKENFVEKMRSYRYRFQDTIVNQLQSFCHALNNEIRVNADSPFTNLSLFDRPKLRQIIQDYGYWFLFEEMFDDIEDAIDLIIYIEKLYMQMKIKERIPLTFPVDTINISIDDNGNIIDKDWLKTASMVNTSGRFNIYLCNVNDFKFQQCCRYSLDFKAIQGLDSFGNGGMSMIGHRVVTINMPRIAYETKGDYSKARELVFNAMELARKVLRAHKEIILDGIKKDMFIVFKYGFVRKEAMFSTIGIVGVYEFFNYCGVKNYVDEASDLFEDMEEKLNEFAAEDKGFYNMEAVPAESAAATLVKLDKLFYRLPDEIELYSNQFIPLWENVDIFTKMKVDAKLVGKLSGGAISHINIGSTLTQEQVRAIIVYAAKIGLQHFALNPFICQCQKCGEIHYGRLDKCPSCKSEDLVRITRVVGFFTPIDSWNNERQREFWRRYIYNPSRHKLPRIA